MTEIIRDYRKIVRCLHCTAAIRNHSQCSLFSEKPAEFVRSGVPVCTNAVYALHFLGQGFDDEEKAAIVEEEMPHVFFPHGEERLEVAINTFELAVKLDPRRKLRPRRLLKRREVPLDQQGIKRCLLCHHVPRRRGLTLGFLCRACQQEHAFTKAELLTAPLNVIQSRLSTSWPDQHRADFLEALRRVRCRHQAT